MLRTPKDFLWSRCLILVACLFLFGLAAALCSAQDTAPAGGQYKQLSVSKKYQKANIRQISRIVSDIRRIINRDKITAETEKKLKDYYEGYFFPRWTVPGNYPDLPTFRKKLKDNFNLAKDPKTFSTLLQIALDNLTPLATSPDYHPAVRFNAVVMIGRLNAKYIPKRSIPEAYPKALNILLRILDDSNENDAARFGAMLGVVRHAQFNNDAASHPKIIDALLKQATDQKAPMNRSPEGHEWFRATAIEGLAHAKDSQVSKVAPALAKIINDETATDSLRLAAANSLGKLNLTPDSGANSAVTIRSLAELASKAVQQEVEACEKDVDKTIDSSKLMSQLLPVRVALSGSDEKRVSSPQGGLAKVTNDKPFLKKVWKLVDGWYDKLDDKDLIPDDTIEPNALMDGERPPARVATEELIKNLKLQLQEMDNLIGVGGNSAN